MAYCPSCGTNKGESSVCPKCGQGAMSAPPPSTPVPGAGNWQAPGSYTQNVYVQNTGTNGMAIASFVCAFLCSLLAVIFGHIALSQIGKTGQGGRGLAIAGLVLGYIGVGIGIFVWLALVGAASGY